MKNFGCLIISVIGLIVSFLVFLFTHVYIWYAVLLALATFTVLYLLTNYFMVRRHYNKAKLKAYNKSQGLTAHIGLFLVLTIYILCIYLVYALNELSVNVITNIILIIFVGLIDVYSFKGAYVYLVDDYLIVNKAIHINDIVRYIAYKNRKGKYSQMQIIYANGSKDLYLSYSKELEDLLDQVLSKKKRGY